jgi:hypothetical protein
VQATPGSVDVSQVKEAVCDFCNAHGDTDKDRF